MKNTREKKLKYSERRMSCRESYFLELPNHNISALPDHATEYFLCHFPNFNKLLTQ